MKINRKSGILLIVLLMLAVTLPGCAGTDIGLSHKKVDTDDSYTAPVDMITLAKQDKELDKIDGIDDPAITVNGEPITKRTIEISKIANSHKNLTETEIIDSIIRELVLNIEADRLSIKPEQEKIDSNMDLTRKFLEEEQPGADQVLSYISEKGITLEEYLSISENNLYKMLQRDALREHMGFEDAEYSEEYEKYKDELVKKAEIEILDPEIKELYK